MQKEDLQSTEDDDNNDKSSKKGNQADSKSIESSRSTEDEDEDEDEVIVFSLSLSKIFLFQRYWRMEISSFILEHRFCFKCHDSDVRNSTFIG